MVQHMSKKELAHALRKKGKSYNEISSKLAIAKSTLSYWFQKDAQSSELKELLTRKAQIQAKKKLRLMAKAHKEKWEAVYKDYQKDARTQYATFKSQKLFIFGLGIYWGEGDRRKQNSIVRVGNVDDQMLRSFVLFLINYCGIDSGKIRVWLLLYPDNNEQSCKRYWSSRLAIPQKQFIKSQHAVGRHKTKRLPHGVCYVQAYSREVKVKILEWIRLCADDCIVGRS